ncbi:MAG: hypothetical protein ACYDEI_09335 [Erysipelotrichaceae bacterium]
MSNLLKITTKPIKISVQVEKGKYIKVEQVIKLQNKKRVKTQANYESVKKNEAVHTIQALPNNIKLNEPKNNINQLIQKNITQKESINVAVYHQNSTNMKIEPIQNEVELKYLPSDLNFVVSQYSEIKFEYVGDPIYIPESANPNKEK